MDQTITETVQVSNTEIRNTPYPAHPMAEICPKMSEDEYQELLIGIKRNGLMNPIVILDEQVLDGLHRQRACFDTGTAPKYVNFIDLNLGVSPEIFVLGQNILRRHLTVSQRGMLAAKLIESRGADNPAANLRQEGRVSEVFAEKLGISPRTIESGTKVMKKGAEELKQAVYGDEMSISAAAAIADLPHKEQKAAVETHRKKTAAVATKEDRKKNSKACGNPKFSKPFVWWGKSFKNISGAPKATKDQDAVVVAFEPAIMEKATELLNQLVAAGCSVHATDGFKFQRTSGEESNANEHGKSGKKESRKKRSVAGKAAA
ncbi:MAG: ParB N-terminal domain-containing protein [Planctomycetota bacterium]